MQDYDSAAAASLLGKCQKFGPSGVDLFDSEYYRKTYKLPKHSPLKLFLHYINSGWKKGYNPSHFFDTDYYLNSYPEVRSARIAPLMHYVEQGYLEGRHPNARTRDEFEAPIKSIAPLFDAGFYQKTYQDLIGLSEEECLIHYALYGWKEGRNPSIWFDTQFYINSYEDARAYPSNPLYHYLLIGRIKGYQPSYNKNNATLDAPCLFSSNEGESQTKIDPSFSALNERYRVTIQSVTPTALYGWAVDLDYPSVVLHLEVLSDGTPVDTIKTGSFRVDFASVNPNGRHGFAWMPPQALRDGKARKIQLRVESMIYSLPAPYADRVIFKQIEIAGFIDSAAGGQIEGWVFDLDDVGAACYVNVFVDGVAIARILANRPRPDVKEHLGGPVECGLSYNIPDKYRDGQPHEVVCRVNDRVIDAGSDARSGVVFGISQAALFEHAPSVPFTWLRHGHDGLPDLFAVRSSENKSAHALIAIVSHRGGWDELEECCSLAFGDTPLTLFICVTNTEVVRAFTDRIASCSEIFLLEYSRHVSEARVALHLLNSGVLNEFNSVAIHNPPGRSSSGKFPTGVRWRIEPQGDIGVLSDSFATVELAADESLLRVFRIVIPRTGGEVRGAKFFRPSGEVVVISGLVASQLSVLQLVTADTLERPWLFVVGALAGYFAQEGGMSVRHPDPEQSVMAGSTGKSAQRSIKAIAFLLPQFHPVRENDLWWGKGFTEWNNVVRAKPLFRFHEQPRLPRDLGFYDLRSPDTQRRQAALAAEHGVYGFCYYYYWFSGRKILEAPIEQMLSSGEPDQPFCVCWANENWSRNWDGQDRFVLLKQEYSLESNKSLIHEFIKIMRDERYIRYNGRPILLVYRIRTIPKWNEVADLWRDECRKAGLGEIHLCAVRFGLEALEGSPGAFGLDSYVLFPPHETVRKDVSDRVADRNSEFNGEILSYQAVVEGDLERFNDGYPWPVHRGVMMGWDNTARRRTSARVFHGATPLRFRNWLAGVIEQEARFAAGNGSESLLFINAWNEWAEGTTLEPDQKFGDGYLRAVLSTVGPHTPKFKRSRPHVLSASSQASSSSSSFAPTVNVTKNNTRRTLDGARLYEFRRPTIMLCAHVSGHQLFGGERSFLDIVKAIANMDYNLVVVLPSDNNKEYVEEIKTYSWKIAIFYYPQWFKNRYHDQYIVLNFSDVIAQFNVTLVYCNTIVLLEPLVAAKRMNRLRVIHARELISLDSPLQERLGVGPEEAISAVFSRSDFIIANSKATARLFERRGRTFYVPNAVNIPDYNFSPFKRGTIRFGIVSSNLAKKGISDFLEVARLCLAVTDAKFVIIGPESVELRARQSEGSIPANVDLLGYKETPTAAMAELDILLSLSSFAESFGRTVAEAMASGKPVIGYEWGAVPELVEHGKTGFLAPYRDVEAVAEICRSLTRDSARIHEIAAAAKAHVAKSYSYKTLQRQLKRALVAIFEKRELSEPAGVNIQGVHEAKPLTIVMPVYNAPDEMSQCIESVLKHTDMRTVRLLVVDDASLDPKVKSLLAAYRDDDGVQIISNKENLGYTRTINMAISREVDRDIVLLNSDAQVTPNWLSGLRSVAYMSERAGTVTAMSDNAGAFSFPIFNERARVPDNFDRDAFAIRIIQHTRDCGPVEVPTGSGFCMYIRRRLIDEIGLFDEQAFPRGYGEENDFCMRAYKADWKNYVTPWAYVYHERSASFKDEKTALVKSGMDLVMKRYPDYASLVKVAFASQDMQRLRKAVYDAFS